MTSAISNLKSQISDPAHHQATKGTKKPTAKAPRAAEDAEPKRSDIVHDVESAEHLLPDVSSIENIGYVTNGMFLREHVGTCTVEDCDYELSVDLGTHTPLVFNPATRQYFVLPWADIVALAIQRGIKESRDQG